jgi:hypothetical protein
MPRPDCEDLVNAVVVEEWQAFFRSVSDDIHRHVLRQLEESYQAENLNVG